MIFSSRTIPGNEKAVGRVINGLIGQGIEVITDRTHLVHVSGHPRRDEMAELYGWVRPRIAMPVHGEALHLSEHAELARARRRRRGDPVRRRRSGAARARRRRDRRGAGRAALQGRRAADLGAGAHGRRTGAALSFSGIVVVSLAISDKGALLADPEVELIGIPEVNAGKQSMTEIAYDAVVETFEHLPKARRRDPEAVEESVKRAVRAAIAGNWGKKPICIVHVVAV